MTQTNLNQNIRQEKAQRAKDDTDLWKKAEQAIQEAQRLAQRQAEIMQIIERIRNGDKIQ